MTTIAVATGMLCLAGLLRGFTGFGFGLAAVPLLSLVMPPAHAIPIVLMLQFCVSLAGLREALDACDWRSIRLLAMGAAAATPVGVWGLAQLPAGPVRMVIALAVVGGALVLSRGFRMQAAPVGASVLPFGLLSGLFNGLAGIPGPPIIAFFLASPIPSRVARASMTVFFLATSVLALIPIAWLGLIDHASALSAALGLPAVLLGSWFGGRLYHRSADRHYRTVSIGLLLVLAAISAWRAVMGAMA